MQMGNNPININTIMSSKLVTDYKAACLQLRADIDRTLEIITLADAKVGAALRENYATVIDEGIKFELERLLSFLHYWNVGLICDLGDK